MRHAPLKHLSVLLAMLALAGCTDTFTTGIFNERTYPPISSRIGIEPPSCYGQRTLAAECKRPVHLEKQLAEKPNSALTPIALKRLSWYITNAPGDTQVSWESAGIVYQLYLTSPVTLPSKKNSCRDATLLVRPNRSDSSWHTFNGPFCYSERYGLWAPAGFDFSTME